MEKSVRIEWVVMLIGLVVLIPWPFVRSSAGYTPSWYRALLGLDLVAMGFIALRRWKRMRDIWR